MPQVFVIDQAKSFVASAFLSSEPKMVMGQQIQDTDKQSGMPKWSVEIVIGFKDNFGKINNEVIKVGYTGPKDPGQGLPMYTPVQLVNFQVGVMDKTRRNKDTGQTEIIGAQIWYRCDAFQPAQMPKQG